MRRSSGQFMAVIAGKDIRPPVFAMEELEEAAKTCRATRQSNQSRMLLAHAVADCP